MARKSNSLKKNEEKINLKGGSEPSLEVQNPSIKGALIVMVVAIFWTIPISIAKLKGSNILSKFINLIKQFEIF